MFFIELVALKSESLQDIYNYLEIGEIISTSSQPTEKQFTTIREVGFENVINLAPLNTKKSLKNESENLAKLGIYIIHLPVVFSNPTEENYNAFVGHMKTLTGENVWVHCAANMRVSAFIYRYCCNMLGEQSQNAKKDLAKIWALFVV